MKFRVWNDIEKKFENPERYYVDSNGKLYYREPMDDSVEPASPHLTWQYETDTIALSGVVVFDD